MAPRSLMAQIVILQAMGLSLINPEPNCQVRALSLKILLRGLQARVVSPLVMGRFHTVLDLSSQARVLSLNIRELT